jgi:hypothetical protein
VSISVKPNHPLTEQIAAHLLGIERVPPREASRMVNRAAVEAAKWHDAEIERLRAIVDIDEWREQIEGAWRDGFYEGAALGDDLISGTVEKWAKEYADREVQQ